MTPEDRLKALRAQWEARQQAVRDEQARLLRAQEASQRLVQEISQMQARKAELEKEIQALGG